MIIVADEQILGVKKYFPAPFELVLKSGRKINQADVKDADVLLVRSVTAVNESLLSNTRVRFVGSMTAGTDHLDTLWLDQAGIAWATAKGFNAPPVADYVVSVLAALSHINLAKKKRAAIIGVGEIGRLVNQRLLALNYDVLLCDPFRAQQEKDFCGISRHDITDVDLITLHVPLTRESEHATYHFLDRHFLQRQKPGCVLLNASRGGVIDSSALLSYGPHLQWCFDVWEHEPDINKQIVQQAVIATPHIAGYSVQSKQRGIDMIYRAMLEKNIIAAHREILPSFPTHKLRADSTISWRNLILAVFNPLTLTQTMREILLAADDVGAPFDEMRHQFQERHEFAFTRIEGELSADERDLLIELSFQIFY